MTTEGVEKARPKGLRREQYEKLLLAFVVVTVCAILYVYWRLSQTTKQAWVYQAADDITARMSRFHMASEEQSSTGKFLLRILPYSPLAPASLFLTIVLVYFLHGSPYLRRIPDVRKAIVRVRRKFEFVRRWPALSEPLTRIRKALTRYHRRAPELWKKWTNRFAIGCVSVIVWLIGYWAVETCETPRAAAFKALFGAAAVTLLAYACLNHSSLATHEIAVFHKFCAVALALAGYVAAVLLVSDSAWMFRILENERMRPLRTIEDIIVLDAKHRSSLTRAAVALSQFDPANDSTAVAVRTAASSLLATFENGDATLIRTNRRRAWWCIVMIAGSVGVWIFTPPRVVSLLLSGVFVLSAYIAIGVIFGLIYYNYYLYEMTAYNLVLDTFGNRGRIGYLSGVLDPTRDWAGPQAWNDALWGIATKLDDPYYEDSIRKGFCSSVFAQDSPQMSVDSAGPTRSSEIFAGSFQFNEGEHVVVPERDQARVVASNQSCLKEIKTQSCADRVLASLGSSGPRAWRLGKSGTNAETMCRLTEMLCNETLAPDQQTDRGYVVDVNAGADCRGKEKRNESLVQFRKVEAALWFNRVLLGVVDVDVDHHRRNPRRVKGLLEAGPGNESIPYLQRRAPTGCDDSTDFRSLWPVDSRTNPVIDDRKTNPWRAAIVRVRRIDVDSSLSARLSIGLSAETKLSEMVYFSFVSFTTTGYGDIKAMSGPARLCVILENILEIIFAAFFFAAVQKHHRDTDPERSAATGAGR